MPGLGRRSGRADDRMPISHTRAPSLAALGVALVLTGCGTAALPTSSGATVSAGPSSPSRPSTASIASGSPSSVDGSAGPAVASASPLAGVEPVEPPRLATTTLICERWGPEPPASLVTCGDAAGLALAAISSTTAVTRLDVGYGEWCVTSASPCGDRSADVTWVIARTRPPDTLRLRVGRLDGELAVWPAVPGPPVRSTPFDPPPRRAPPLGPDAPTDLAHREPYPLCGEEDLGASEAFSTAARECFLTAVLAGSSAELDSRATSTEGDAVLTVYRFAGSGAVRRAVRSNGVWSASACGIARIDTPAVFEMAGGCVTVSP